MNRLTVLTNWKLKCLSKYYTWLIISSMNFLKITLKCNVIKWNIYVPCKRFFVYNNRCTDLCTNFFLYYKSFYHIDVSIENRYWTAQQKSVKQSEREQRSKNVIYVGDLDFERDDFFFMLRALIRKSGWTCCWNTDMSCIYLLDASIVCLSTSDDLIQYMMIW